MKYGLGIARFIDDLYYTDESTVIIVYGGFLGTGKSSYCIKAMAEVYGSHSGHADNVPDFEAIKDYIVFPPKDFVDRVLRQHGKEKVICWDDMGLWLFALDWYDPFVKATTKYLNVMRTDWAVVLGNTPTPKMIVRRIQRFPESIRVKVTKVASNIDHPKRPRYAQAYKVWMSPDLKKSGVTKRGMWKDLYYALMPDDFYEWYKPIRDEYAMIAKRLMLQELNKMKKKDKEDIVEEGFKKAIPEPERVKELEELVAQRI